MKTLLLANLLVLAAIPLVAQGPNCAQPENQAVADLQAQRPNDAIAVLLACKKNSLSATDRYLLADAYAQTGDLHNTYTYVLSALQASPPLKDEFKSGANSLLEWASRGLATSQELVLVMSAAPESQSENKKAAAARKKAKMKAQVTASDLPPTSSPAQACAGSDCAKADVQQASSKTRDLPPAPAVYLPAPEISPDEADLRAILAAQAAAWNRADIPAFMQSYEDSPETTFIGATVRKGYQPILERYLQAYSTPEQMGVLTYSNIEVRLLPGSCASVEFATVTGRFHLDRTTHGEAKKDDGVFSLVWRKGPNGWKILLDHTS
jgi:ketosteroid isomerase-like protein